MRSVFHCLNKKKRAAASDNSKRRLTADAGDLVMTSPKGGSLEMSMFKGDVAVSRPVSVANPTHGRTGRPQSKKFNSARDLGAAMVSNPMMDAGISSHNSKGKLVIYNSVMLARSRVRI